MHSWQAGLPPEFGQARVGIGEGRVRKAGDLARADRAAARASWPSRAPLAELDSLLVAPAADRVEVLEAEADRDPSADGTKRRSDSRRAPTCAAGEAAASRSSARAASVLTSGGGGGTCWQSNCSRTKMPRAVGEVSTGPAVAVRNDACPSSPARRASGREAAPARTRRQAREVVEAGQIGVQEAVIGGERLHEIAVVPDQVAQEHARLLRPSSRPAPA